MLLIFSFGAASCRVVDIDVFFLPSRILTCVWVGVVLQVFMMVEQMMKLFWWNGDCKVAEEVMAEES
jgi:hypothetical protein